MTFYVIIIWTCVKRTILEQMKGKRKIRIRNNTFTYLRQRPHWTISL